MRKIKSLAREGERGLFTPFRLIIIIIPLIIIPFTINIIFIITIIVIIGYER